MIIVVILGLVLFGILVIFFYGPDGAIQKAAEAVFNKIIPVETETKRYTGSIQSQNTDALTEYAPITNALEKAINAPEGTCITKIPKLSKEFFEKKYSILIKNEGSDGMSIQLYRYDSDLQEEELEERGLEGTSQNTGVTRKKTLEKTTPCIVQGIEGSEVPAKLFYQNFLEGKIDNVDSNTKAKFGIPVSSIFISSYEKMYVRHKSDDKKAIEYEWRTNDNDPPVNKNPNYYVLKNMKTSEIAMLCLIPTYDDGDGGDCSPPEKGLIDDDCLEIDKDKYTLETGLEKGNIPKCTNPPQNKKEETEENKNG